MTSQVAYSNLDLDLFDYRADAAGEHFRVRVADSPVGQQRLADADAVTLPPGIRHRTDQIMQTRRGLGELIAVGEELAACMFPPRARSLLAQARALLQVQGGRLRIRLRIDHPRLADLAWEYAYLPTDEATSPAREPTGFLALDARCSIVRYELLPLPALPLRPSGAGRVRLVALQANPRTYDPLPLDREEQYLRQALDPLVARLRADYYRDATLATFEAALEGGADVFHFTGHGMTAERDQITLLDATGQPATLTADRLALNLIRARTRVVVLSACESSHRDASYSWDGIAATLIRAGVPAVLGMQYAVSAERAIEFNRSFYQALVSGAPIDDAVSAGRLAIFNRSPADEHDWGAPVLYLRSEASVLFPASAAPTPVSGSAPSTIDTGALRAALIAEFSLNELKELCHDVTLRMRAAGLPFTVDLELLAEGGKAAKVLDLIGFLERRKCLAYLVEAARQARPGLV